MRIRNVTAAATWITAWGLTRKHPKVWWPGCHRPGLVSPFTCSICVLVSLLHQAPELTGSGFRLLAVCMWQARLCACVLVVCRCVVAHGILHVTVCLATLHGGACSELLTQLTVLQNTGQMPNTYLCSSFLQPCTPTSTGPILPRHTPQLCDTCSCFYLTAGVPHVVLLQDIVIPIPAQTPGMLRTPLNVAVREKPERDINFFFAGEMGKWTV